MELSGVVGRPELALEAALLTLELGSLPDENPLFWATFPELEALLTASIWGRSVETVPRVAVYDVIRRGTGRIATVVELGGQWVRIEPDADARPRFRCPGCGQRVRFLHTPLVRCQRCAGIQHASWRKANDATLHRVRRLRRALAGAAEHPFGPLPAATSQRAARLRLAIGRAEVRLLAETERAIGRAEKGVQRLAKD